MNLFCFSLEGSMDSLYEAAQSSGGGASLATPRRSCSPAVWEEESARMTGPGRSISVEIGQIQGSNAKKKKRRTHISKSASDIESLGLWTSKHRRDYTGAKVSRQSGARKKDRGLPSQAGGLEGGKPSQAQCDGLHREPSVHASGVCTEPRAAARRGQKAGKKSPGKAAREGSRKGHSSTGSVGSAPQAAPYMDVAYRSYPGKASTSSTQENSATHLHYHQHSHPHQRLSTAPESSPVWADAKHTCCGSVGCRPHSGDFTASQASEWARTGAQAATDGEAGNQDSSRESRPPRVLNSTTHADLSNSHRSTSFGRFEGIRLQSKQEDNGNTMTTEEADSSDSNKPTGLGKKMKAISMTMRRKMGKKNLKSFSEESQADDTDRERDAEAEAEETIPEQASAKTNNSLESLYSGQSSSSGVTSESNGSKRDSLRLEEDGSYPGQFCGRARVHTDFVPSPYDTDSLTLKVGDIISVIKKPPMGIWSGRLNNKVGNFKFIYVDVLVEKESEEEVPIIRQQKLCRRPRPNTLLELLEQLQLQEYASALLLNGYQTVDDLMHLQEKHLMELNVQDPEHRQRLLAAAACRYAEGDEQQRAPEEGKPSRGLEEEEDKCLRDSGCFIPSECSDPLKEEGGNPTPSTTES